MSSKYTERDYYILVQNVSLGAYHQHCISKIIVMNQEYYHINIRNYKYKYNIKNPVLIFRIINAIISKICKLTASESIRKEIY